MDTGKIADNPTDRNPLAKTWEVGVVSTCERSRTLLPRTIASLESGGFKVNRIFMDGDADVPFFIPMSTRSPKVGVHPNTHLCLLEMFYRNRFADLYLVAQDDILAVRNLRQYLDTQPYPEQGYWNLSTHMSNVHLGRLASTRWFPGHQNGYGALGIVMDNRAARQLLTTPGLIDWATDPKAPRRFPKYIDGAIATTFAALGYTQYCHMPSLLCHTGYQSTIRRQRVWDATLTDTFPGEDFDAMSWTDHEDSLRGQAQQGR